MYFFKALLCEGLPKALRKRAVINFLKAVNRHDGNYSTKYTLRVVLFNTSVRKTIVSDLKEVLHFPNAIKFTSVSYVNVPGIAFFIEGI